MTVGANSIRDVFIFHAKHLFANKIRRCNNKTIANGIRSCAFLFILCQSLQADYQSGLDAYLIGDYATAMTDWQAVAAGNRLDETPNIYAETHYAIAMLYWQGMGVPQNYNLSHEWMLRAAQMNHAAAQAKLGFMYAEGVGVEQDLEQAYQWYAKAARQGDIDGQYNLGIFYLNGWGTPQDTTMAKQYLAAASAQGDQAAEEALQSLLSVGADSSANIPNPTTDSPASLPTVRADSSSKSSVKSNYVNPNPKPYRATPVKPSNNRGLNPLLQGASWILAQNPDHYTLQVIALSARKNVEALVSKFHDLSPFAIYTQENNGKTLYVLVQGNYENVDAARRARDNFPRTIQKTDKLWIRQFARIQELVEE